MKVDRTTIILATLALVSIGFAQRAFGQTNVGDRNPSIGPGVTLSHRVIAAP